MKKIKAFLLHHELLIILLCIVSLLRLPSLLEPYWYGDEGIYLTLGNGIRHGMQLYRDVHDNKPPGIYVLAAIAGSMFWFRFMLLVWNLASIAVFSYIANKILPVTKKITPIRIGSIDFPRPTLATLATVLFAMLPMFAEGNIANGEIFMVLPTLIGMAALIKLWKEKVDHPLRLTIVAGIAFSLAFLIKVPAIFDAFAAGFFFYLLTRKTAGNPIKQVIQKVVGIFKIRPWLFAIAFLIPILLSIGYYASIGVLQPYLNSALLQNVGYLSSWKTGTHEASKVGQSGLMNRAIALAVFSVIVLVVSGVITAEILFASIWFAFALFGALLSERPYPHYLIQIIPPAALLLPLAIRQLQQGVRTKFKDIKTVVSLASVGLIVFCFIGALVSFYLIKFWYYPIRPYYTNYVKFMTKQISKDTYLSYFDKTLPEQYDIAEYIVSTTTPNDRVFLWGDIPTMYALTRRLPPGRFTSAYHIKDFNGYSETLIAITKEEPRIIVVDQRMDEFPGLASILFDEYRLVDQTEHFRVYKRML